MYQKYFILVLCLFLLGGSLEAKDDPERNDWTVSNTMSREDHEHHVPVRPSETIDIDEHPPQSDVYSGDGTDMSDDDGSSGMGWDDEDDTEGSAGGSERSDCRKIRDEMKNQGIKGHYIPKCTSEGEFETKQCDSSAQECWCVDTYGERIPNTAKPLGQTLDCSKVGKLTDCLREYEERMKIQMPGAPSPPKCTPEGEYEKKQCHGSTGQCWCVDVGGLEIGGTRRSPGHKLDCDHVVPIYPEPVGTPKPRKPSQGGYEEEEIVDEIIPDIPEDRSEEDIKNSIDNMPGNEQPGQVDIQTATGEDDNQLPNGPEQHQSDNSPPMKANIVISQPGLLAGIIGGAVVGLLCAVLLVMFIVYRMRKKDEGSYALDEPKRSPSLHTYARATNREFYA